MANRLFCQDTHGGVYKFHPDDGSLLAYFPEITDYYIDHKRFPIPWQLFALSPTDGAMYGTKRNDIPTPTLTKYDVSGNVVWVVSDTLMWYKIAVSPDGQYVYTLQRTSNSAYYISQRNTSDGSVNWSTPLSGGEPTAFCVNHLNELFLGRPVPELSSAYKVFGYNASGTELWMSSETFPSNQFMGFYPGPDGDPHAIMSSWIFRIERTTGSFVWTYNTVTDEWRNQMYSVFVLPTDESVYTATAYADFQGGSSYDFGGVLRFNNSVGSLWGAVTHSGAALSGVVADAADNYYFTAGRHDEGQDPYKISSRDINNVLRWQVFTKHDGGGFSASTEGLGNLVIADMTPGATVSLVSPLAGATIPGNAAVAFAATASPTAPGTAITRVVFLAGSTEIGEGTFNVGTGQYEGFAEYTGELGPTTIRARAVPDVGDFADDVKEVVYVDRGVPEAILVQTGYYGVIADVRDDPEFPDTAWMNQQDTGAVAGELRFSFFDIGKALRDATNAQQIELWLRKQGASGDANPTVTVDLYESGSFVRQLASQAISNLSGVLLTLPWTSTELIDDSANGLEVRIVSQRGAAAALPGGTTDFAPLAELERLNLVGDADYIFDDPDTPDAFWLTASANDVQTIVRVSFPISSAPLSSSDQVFAALVRKTNSANTTMDIELWESGSLVRVLAAGLTVNTSGAGQIVTATWNKSELIDQSGDGVQLRLVGYGTNAGSGATRSSVEFGAAEWRLSFDPYTPHPSGVDVGAVRWVADTYLGPEAEASVSLPAFTASGTAEARGRVALIPDGDDALTNFTSTAVNAWSAVDDDPDAANDADYIKNAAQGNAEIVFTLTDPPPVAGTFDSFEIVLRAKKTES